MYLLFKLTINGDATGTRQKVLKVPKGVSYSKSPVGLKGKHGKKNVPAVLSMGFFENTLP